MTQSVLETVLPHTLSPEALKSAEVIVSFNLKEDAEKARWLAAYLSHRLELETEQREDVTPVYPNRGRWSFSVLRY